MVADIELVPDAEDPQSSAYNGDFESLVIRRDITADATQAVLRLGYWWKMGK